MSSAIEEGKTYEPGTYPDLPPPASEIGVYGWVYNNLLKGWVNSILTAVTIVFLVVVIPPSVNWLFLNAVFEGASRDDCRAIMNEAGTNGACWAFIGHRFELFVYGFYPVEERWRVDISFILMLAALVPVLWDKTPNRGKLMIASAIAPFVIGWLLVGGLGLEPVPTDKFGGFMLTLVIGVTGIVGSLPIGIVLALGRQSHLPAVRMVCVVFIEFIRGVPLITLLFVASTMLNYFLPPGTTFDLLLRVLIMVTLFASAGSRRLDGPEILAIDAPDHSAAGAENFDSRDRQHFHRTVQGYDAGYYHRPVRPARRRPCVAGGHQVAGFVDRGLRFRRHLLFHFLYCDGALLALSRKETPYRTLAGIQL
jgi:general L-amino acid transport system permease protein